MKVINQKKIVVVSAPSGAGKTSLNFRLMQECPHIELAISHTTRLVREGEKDGVHYHFIDAVEFEDKINRGDFIEWARVHGNLYGTAQSEIQRILQKGHTPLLEIDVQGWLIAKRAIPQAKSIFILPPSIRSLWDRLESRGTDSLEVRLHRFKNAVGELEAVGHYEYYVINDNIDKALRSYRGVIEGSPVGSMGTEECKIFCKKLIHEFQSTDWKHINC